MNLTPFQKFLLFLFLAVIFLYSFNRLKESDSFYHIKAGQVIWEIKAIPHEDIFSYTAAGTPWITHEWLSELIFYFFHRLGGFWGLIVFIASLSALTYYVLFRLALFKGANFYLSLLLFFLIAVLTFGLWTPRPQVFAFCLTAFLIYFLERYRDGGKNKYLVFAVLDVWLWANMNASFVLGIAIIGLYFAVSVINKLIFHIFSLKDISRLGYILIAAAALSLINPNTYKIFVYSLSIQSAVNTLGILEWKSILVFLYQPEPKIFIAEAALSLALLIWWFGIRKETRDFAFIGLPLAVSVLPLISIRHIGFWPIGAAVPVILAVSGALRNVLKKTTPRFLGALIFIFLIFFGAARVYVLPDGSVNQELIPVYAVNFLESQKIGGRYFNLYNDGGYLIFRLWPDEKVFIDGRSEVFAGRPIREIFTVVGNLKGWEKLVDEKYKINAFILSYRPDTIAKSIEPLVRRLMKENWPLVYWDDTSIIFVRNIPENREIVSGFAVRHVSPFREPSSILPFETKDSLSEIQSLLARSSSTLALQDYANRILTSH